MKLLTWRGNLLHYWSCPVILISFREAIVVGEKEHTEEHLTQNEKLSHNKNDGIL